MRGFQATEVERYGRDEYSLDEMVLTNKYIICVYEKSNGLFSKAESIEPESISSSLIIKKNYLYGLVLLPK